MYIYIERREMAALIGITQVQMESLFKREKFAMPNPVKKNGNALLYDRFEFMRWLAHWLENQNKPLDTVDQVTFQDVMKGHFDSPRQKQKYQFKKLIAKTTKPTSDKQSIDLIFNN